MTSTTPALDADRGERPSTTEPVAIVGGGGALGFGLALRLRRAGIPVTIGSRDGTRAAEAAEKARAACAGAAVDGAENAVAVEGAELVLLTVPFASQAATLKGLRDALRPGQLVIDCSVPLAVAVGGRPTRMLGVWEGSAAQQAAALVPAGVRVVSALHTVSAAALADLDSPLSEDVLICGDDGSDKQRVAALIEQIEGLRVVDAGRLENSRTVESLTALLIGINVRYKSHAGIRVTGLPTLWGRPSGVTADR